MAIPTSFRSTIAAAIEARLALIPELKYVNFDDVKLAATDFADYQIPAVQLIDLGDANSHEMRRVQKLWSIAIEVIVGPTTAETPEQTDLWDLMELVERTLFAVPNLGIPGVIHMHLVTTTTDLHFMKPFYVGRIEIAVQYYQPLVDEC